MKPKRHVMIGTAFVILLAALAVGQFRLQQTAAAQAKNGVQAPRFEVDPMWPKPLPSHWLLGSTVGVSVDARDHVFVVHRGAGTLNERTEIGAAVSPRTAEECCVPAPPILEFDPAGTLVGHWGGSGQGYEGPASNPRVTADQQGNVRNGGNAPQQ